MTSEGSELAHPESARRRGLAPGAPASYETDGTSSLRVKIGGAGDLGPLLQLLEVCVERAAHGGQGVGAQVEAQRGVVGLDGLDDGVAGLQGVARLLAGVDVLGHRALVCSLGVVAHGVLGALERAVVEVRAEVAWLHDHGVGFYRGNSDTWLADAMPVTYLSLREV